MVHFKKLLVATMATDIPPPKAFSVEENPRTVAQRWVKYIDSFNIYLDCLQNKKDAQKVSILLHIAGPEIQDIFKTLTPEDNTYVKAVEALSKYFNPTENIRYERSIFMALQPNESETTDMFVTRLKKQVSLCKYTKDNIEDDLIVDLVICKCNSSELREKFLQAKNLDLKKMLEIARAYEQSRVQNKKIEENYQRSQSVSVNKLESANKVVQQKRYRPTYNSNAHKAQKAEKNKTNNFNTYQGYQGYNKPLPQNNQKFKECSRCGYNSHYPNDRNRCPGYRSTCQNCGMQGHFTRKCLKRQAKQSERKNVNMCHNEKEQERLENEKFAFQLNSTNKNNRIMCPIQINGKDVSMQLDTGADMSIISEHVARNIPYLKIERDKSSLITDYSSREIEIVGKADVMVKYEKQILELPLVIVSGDRKSLLGLNWIEKLKLNLPELLKETQLSVNAVNAHELLKDYETVFEPGLGTIENVTANLELKENAIPKFLPPRQVPFAIKTQVEQEIMRLEQEGNWKKVKYSNWATPLVPVAKPDGSVRLCGDYKVTVNPQLNVAQHPLPNPSIMFATMGNCKVFSKIDLKTAFQQLVMDENSQEICTLNTPLGLYQPKRLPYGIASSPALWQETMDKIFTGLPGVFCFVDDIVVGGENKEQHDDRLKNVLKRMKENGIKINKDKCLFNVSSVKYLGFVIDGNGIHKTEDKIRAVKEARIPENVKELQSFLGLVTFYARFIKDLATIAHPLYQLLKNETRWEWSQNCNNAFEKIKQEICSDRFLVHFKEDIPLKLVCDASQIGVGCVLAHEMPDGSEKPIAFASRLLNKAEQNYSQIEKEGLALIYGVKKFHMYLYGKNKFKLVTDHKPLLAILGPKQGLPTLVAARLQRWAIILAAYNYSLEYRPTNKMGNADALSRLPVETAPKEHEISILLTEAQNLPLRAEKIRKHTEKDKILCKVREYMITGNVKFLENEECKAYKAIKDELSLEQGCILRGARVVIPISLRKNVLQEIHEGHQGIVRSKAIARSFVWWPNMDIDIEEYVKACQNCMLQQNNPKKVNLHPWECAKYPWQRLHIDYAGPFLGNSYLVVVDAYSKWPDIIPMHTTTSLSTIKALMTLFSTHGIPERIVTDNGTQFCSEEFKEFLEVNGIKHSLSPPYHPATNGEAERMVQTFKQAMKTCNANAMNIQSSINKFLLTYRTTPHATTGVCPSQLLMGRRIRCKLDLLLPDSENKKESEKYEKLVTLGKVRNFNEGENVIIRNYNNKEKWIKGIVKKKLGTLNYEISLPEGNVVKRHIDQMKSGIDTDPLPVDEVEKSEEVYKLPQRKSRGNPPEILDL